VPDDGSTMYIQSGVHIDTGRGICVLEWGDVRAMLEVPRVHDTAHALHTAATRAEDDIALINTLRDTGMDMTTAVSVLADVRAARGPIPGRPALRVDVVAGANTGLPFVHIARGRMEAALTPDMAREEATRWTECAVASQFDARLRYVLGDYPQLTDLDVDRIFTDLRRASGQTTTTQPKETPP
jgi:hypothetical protein